MTNNTTELSTPYVEARSVLVATFKHAWAVADQKGQEGHRTEAGMDAVLSVIGYILSDDNGRGAYGDLIAGLNEMEPLS